MFKQARIDRIQTLNHLSSDHLKCLIFTGCVAPIIQCFHREFILLNLKIYLAI